MRFLLCLMALLLGLLSGPLSAQSDEMDPLPDGAVETTEQPAQIEWVLPDASVEVGVPAAVRVRVLIDGEFEGLSLKMDKLGEALLIAEEFRQIGPKEFVAGIRLRKAGAYEFKPEVLGKVAGSEQPVRLAAPSLKLNATKPAAEVSTSFRGFTDVRAIPFDYTARNVILGALGFLAVLALVSGGLALRAWLARRPVVLAPVKVLPPIEEALAEVKGLSSLEIFQIRGADAHYTALSMALRRYLERQFGVPAVEMTEDEVIDFVRRNLDTAQQAQALNQVMGRSSLAKFARQPITREIAAEDCVTSLRFLEREQARIEAAETARRARESNSQGSNAA